MKHVVVEMWDGDGAGIRTEKVHVIIGGRNLANVIIWCNEKKIVICSHDYVRPTYTMCGNTSKTTRVTMLEKTMFEVVCVVKSCENVEKRRVGDECPLFGGNKTVTVCVEETVTCGKFCRTRRCCDSMSASIIDDTRWMNLWWCIDGWKFFNVLRVV